MKDQSPKLLEDLVTFFKAKKIDYPVLLLLNAVKPFQRTMFFMFSVFLPLLSVVFGMERSKIIEKIFEDEAFFEQLQTSLEKELK